MAIKGEWVRYGEGSGYFAKPEKALSGLPGVLVIQEVWGVNDQIEDVTRRIAAAGYAALAPDLLAQGGKRPPAVTKERVAAAVAFASAQPPGTMFDPTARAAVLAKLPEDQAREFSETYGQLFSFAGPGKIDALVPPLKLGYRYLRDQRPETTGAKVGCVGFCMGGGLSALLACEEEDLGGAAVFYGNAPAPEKAARIRCPVIAFYGAKDQRVNASIPGFEASMRAAGASFEHHVYEGAAHSFFNDDGHSYDVAAVRDSFARLLGFFARTLSG
jgi:carboxymethylenebutenolidase